MFGYTRKTGENRQRAYAGRISCTDASLEPGQKDIWLSENAIKLKVLASPKPTTFQHYLVQPEPNLYSSGRSKPDTRLVDYDFPTNEETVIRGHKFYWHKGAVGLGDIQQSEKVKDTQITKIHPLKTNVKFKFKVYFENLTAAELGALMWVFDQSAKENMRLKIGMGKPHGMGSIAVKPVLFIRDNSKRHSQLFLKDKWEDGHTRSDRLAANALDVFSKKMLDELNTDLPVDERLDHFTKSPHIGGLLVMLQWPGIESDWARYMEIKHPDSAAGNGKKNEYKERPVLPSPNKTWNTHKKQ
jgi:CRISPR-associated protein (TIGR03986 family)